MLREADSDGGLNAKIESYDSIESVARITRNELVIQFKLRPVLLLQTGTSDQLPDVLVARVNSITEDHRQRRAAWVAKLENNIHPLMLRVGHEHHHGLKVESYVNLTSVQPVNKAAILRNVGYLDEGEMVSISERLILSLEIDVSAYVAQLRPELSSSGETSEQVQLS